MQQITEQARVCASCENVCCERCSVCFVEEDVYRCRTCTLPGDGDAAEQFARMGAAVRGAVVLLDGVADGDDSEA